MIADVHTDLVEEALGELTSLHRDKVKFRAFITAVIRQMQPLIDAGEKMMLWRDIDEAEGESLRRIAEIVGAPILPESSPPEDALAMQRMVIRAQILKNHSHGFTPEMGESMSLLFGNEFAFVWNNKDMSFDVNVAHMLTPLEVQLLKEWDILPRPAGVQLRDFIYWDSALPVFGFEHQVGTFGFGVGYFAYAMR